MKLVISVSGGGALGIGPLQFMRRLEADLKKKYGDEMSLANLSEAFSGSSTGAIVAAGLCKGMSADELFNIYKDNLKSIFKEKKGVLPPIARPNYVRYDNTNLKKMLYSYFPGKLNTFKKPIYIPTTFMNGKSVEKVWDRGDDWMDSAFAVLSSCSAPTYFDLLTLQNGDHEDVYCDAGLWANDPIMILQAGLTRLIKNQKKYKTLFADGYKILSFNTQMVHEYAPPAKKNAIGWLTYLLDEWIGRCGNSNYFEACANIGSENVFRLAPEIKTRYKMDDLSVVDKVVEKWDDYYDNGTFVKNNKTYKVKTELLKFVKSTIE